VGVAVGRGVGVTAVGVVAFCPPQRGIPVAASSAAAINVVLVSRMLSVDVSAALRWNHVRARLVYPEGEAARR